VTDEQYQTVEIIALPVLERLASVLDVSGFYASNPSVLCPRERQIPLALLIAESVDHAVMVIAVLIIDFKKGNL